jgi:hypothetical protein
MLAFSFRFPFSFPFLSQRGKYRCRPGRWTVVFLKKCPPTCDDAKFSVGMVLSGTIVLAVSRHSWVGGIAQTTAAALRKNGDHR